MVQKIRTATDARDNDEFVIIARTDAQAGHGFDDAVERSYKYLHAGADVLFFEAPNDLAELRRVGEKFETLGYDVVLYPALLKTIDCAGITP